MSDAGTVIVVGVTPAQSETVLLEAAKLALRYQAVLVCAYSDVHSYTVEEHPDGSIISAAGAPLELLARMPRAAELVNTLGTDLRSMAGRRWDAC